jgi:hypothetical protein
MADGSDIREYLKKCGLTEGQEINVCDHGMLKNTIEAANYVWAA